MEWVSVDDFSNDCCITKEKIEQIGKNAVFPFRAIFLDENHYGAKSTYTGSMAANGVYSIILDQDDLLTENALDIFMDIIKKYDGNVNFAGVCGRCALKSTRELIGSRVSWSEKLTNELYLRHIEKVRGELLQCTKTKILSQFFEGMKPGYTNGWAWSRIARQYSYVYINSAVRLYDTLNPDSHSNSIKVNHLAAQFDQLSEYIFSNIDYLKHDKWSCYIYLVHWIRFAIHLNRNNFQFIRNVPSAIRYLYFIAYPISFLKYKHDIINGRVG